MSVNDTESPKRGEQRSSPVMSCPLSFFALTVAIFVIQPGFFLYMDAGLFGGGKGGF